MAQLNLVTVFSASESDSEVLNEEMIDLEKVVEHMETELNKAKRRIAGIQLKQRSMKKKQALTKRGMTKSNSTSKIPKLETDAEEEGRDRSAKSPRDTPGSAPSGRGGGARDRAAAATAGAQEDEELRAREKKAAQDRDIAEMQQGQAERQSVERSAGSRRALEDENERGEVYLRGREEGARKFAEREAERAQRGVATAPSGQDDKGGGKGFKGGFVPHTGNPSYGQFRFVPREFREAMAPCLVKSMPDEEKFNVADSFHLGLREFSVHAEARRPDLGSQFNEGFEVTDLDVAIYLVNPSRGNSRTTYEDAVGSRYFQQLRAKFNKIAELRDGLQQLSLVPASPGRLHLVVDQFDGKNLEKTSGIIIRRVGCPSFNCGYRSEIEWLPRVLTANGLFGVGTYAVVATKLQYRYLEGNSDIKEAVFIGELWVTLASRDLAEV